MRGREGRGGRGHRGNVRGREVGGSREVGGGGGGKGSGWCRKRRCCIRSG